MEHVSTVYTGVLAELGTRIVGGFGVSRTIVRGAVQVLAAMHAVRVEVVSEMQRRR